MLRELMENNWKVTARWNEAGIYVLSFNHVVVIKVAIVSNFIRHQLTENSFQLPLEFAHWVLCQS